MWGLYHFLIAAAGLALKVMAPFHEKIRLFRDGRKTVFAVLLRQIAAEDKVIWVHTASLGEFEQGLPLIKMLKREKPDYKILVTFFSPSGYEVKKNSAEADIIVYLPLDTKKNAEQFLSLTHPELAVFVKYEFWPNYLRGLKKRGIKTFLVSGVFRTSQLFFKPYGGFMRKQLYAFERFFVQEEASKALLATLGFTNVTVSGDTRFDRVLELKQRNNSLLYIEEFIGDRLCVVIGSSWQEDEALLVPFINSYSGTAKFIVAPHDVSASQIARLTQRIRKKTVLFSEKAEKALSDYEVFIIDAVGMLTKIYSYAHIAYVGGGMGKKGLHNILEPAVFGIPVIIGKNFKNFNEANALVALDGVVSVQNEGELADAFHRFLTNAHEREQAGSVNASYIQEKSGAVEKIRAFL